MSPQGVLRDLALMSLGTGKPWHSVAPCGPTDIHLVIDARHNVPPAGQHWQGTQAAVAAHADKASHSRSSGCTHHPGAAMAPSLSPFPPWTLPSADVGHSHAPGACLKTR